MFQDLRDALNGNARRQARSNAIAGFASGLLIGAVTALLLAPKSGKELRADIADGAKVGAEKVKEVSHKVAESAKDVTQRAVDGAKEKYYAFKEKKNAVAGEVSEAADEIAEEIRA